MPTPAKFPTQISRNRRFLECEDGTPFFYLGDTAWELFHRLDRDETEFYLQDRAAKGFTTIQAVVLAELNGLQTPNAQGDLPLLDNDPTRPNEAYFRHVDWVIERANELGICVGLLPTWGAFWNRKKGAEPEIFTPENAEIYGEWLGERYKDSAAIWILGGDRPIETATHKQIIEAMARGLRRGDNSRHLMTFHPNGCRSSSEWFHGANWLDFNMAQTGHAKNRANDRFICHDAALSPTKPCLDGEPGYEEIPHDLQPDAAPIEAADVRRFLYQAIFAGACGHTYGANAVWQMWDEGRESLFGARQSWREALQLPGAAQMGHARRLLESRGWGQLLPDNSIITQGENARVLRAENRQIALVYFPDNSNGCRAAIFDLTKLDAVRIETSWFNPRNGEVEKSGVFDAKNSATFEPPTREDWILILEATP